MKSGVKSRLNFDVLSIIFFKRIGDSIRNGLNNSNFIIIVGVQQFLFYKIKKNRISISYLKKL